MIKRYFILTIALFFVLDISSAQKKITLEDIWTNSTYSPKSIPGFKFQKDGKHYTRLEKNAINQYDLTTGAFTKTILDGATIKGEKGFSGNISSYQFSDDESKIMIKSESERIYRRSSRAYFHVYDRSTEKVQALNEEGKVMYATLSPDASKAAYVFMNNLFYIDLNTGITEPITLDGKSNHIINGAADWVYEEEFAFAKAFFWSPDSKKVAYIRFDETDVPEFTMTRYNDDMYPEYETFKYPKVGEINAKVSVHIFDMESEKSNEVDLGTEEEFYVPRVKWTQDANQLCVFKMNRHQNHLQLLLANAKDGMTKVLLDEKNKYFIDITDDLTFLKNGSEFIWSSEKDGYNQIYLYDMEGNQKRKLTPGNYDVRSFYGVDEQNGKIFYRASEISPLESQVYSVDLDGNNKTLLTDFKGTSRAQFSSTFDYYVNTHSTINRAPTYTVYDRNGKKVRVIEYNSNMAKLQEEYGVSPVTFFEFTTSENVTLNGYMIKPKDFKENGRYPVFMTQYSGPGSQSVTDSYKGINYWWYQMLAQNGYIVVCVDGRGTGARGEEFRKMTYLQLGHYETIDQIEAAKYMASLPYTDENRIGIFGWSYGGYMSSLCILKGNDVFKAAIAVAPVTNWKWYDTIYTERYMRTVAENKDGYYDNSPIYFADRLKGNYLLVHGVADDNVHFQHTVEMANALIKANKQFDTYFYPNRNHGIFGDNARIHLYTKMTDFLYEKL